MRKTGHIFLLILVAWWWNGLAQNAGLAYLKINSAAATAPLGSAAVASRYPDAVLSNPASMVSTYSTTLSSSYGSWLQMVRFGQLYGIFALRNHHRLAFSLYHMDIPGIERRITALDRRPINQFQAANQSLGIHYAYMPTKQLAIGLAVHLLHQAIDMYSGTSPALDLGVHYCFLQNKISLGLAYRNLGPAMKLADRKIPLYQIMDAGVEWRAIRNLGVFLGMRHYDGVDRQMDAAVTWDVSNSTRDFTLQLRLGYQNGNNRSMQDGLKWGLGLGKNTNTLRYRFDCSYVPFAILGQAHIFSLQLGGTLRATASLSSDRERFSPHTGQVVFGMRVQRMPNPGRWQLRLTDKQGLLKNEFSGQGLPPLSIEWNGRDRNDRILADGYYQGLLTLYSSSGIAATSNTRTVLLDGRPPDIRLKVVPRFLILSQKKMALKPWLVKSIETDFINPVQSWVVKILDQARQPVKFFQGSGEPPALLDWNLCGDDQRPVTPSNYMALAQATDMVGNLGQSDTLTFTIGYEMQAEARNTIKENPTGFVATLGGILFDFDQATLRPAAHDVLRNITMIMTYYKTATALIGGHTDSKGSQEYNLNLSARRAEEVKRYLVDVMGIAAERLRVQWFGKSVPVSSNDTEEGRQLNRRVEVNISLDGKQGQ